MRNYSHNPKLLLRQGFKFSFFRVTFFSPLLVTTFLLITIPVTAFKPPQFSDYQRKDLAKAGVIKVIYQYEQTANPERKDTLSIRQYDPKGFLITLDSFDFGKDNLYHIFLSQQITYSKEGNLTIVRVEEKNENAVFRTLTLQYFNESEKLIKETVTVDGYTEVIEYTYDTAQNCTEKLNRYGYMTDTTSFLYEYDNYNKIREKCYYNAKLQYFYLYEYNLSGQVIELIKDNQTIEKYEYDLAGKKTRYEFSCLSESDISPPSLGEIRLYYYNDKEQLIQIKQRYIYCNILRTIKYEFVLNLYYMPSGLIESECNSGGCKRFIYLKKS